MDIRLDRSPSDRIPYGLIFGGIALAALVLVRILPVFEMLPSCAFKHLSGAPCPACGSARSLRELAHGNFLSACALNPLFSAAMLGAIGALLFDVVLGLCGLPRPTLRVSRRAGNRLRILAVILFFANWTYLIMDHR